MKAKRLSYLLALVLMLTMIPQTAFADPSAENSDHDKIVDSAIQEIAGQFGDDSRDPYNYIEKSSGTKLRAPARSAYPASFDLRKVDTDGDGNADSNYVTPVKLQNPFGSCWGFSAIAAAETSILGNEKLNRSSNGGSLYSTSLKQGEDGKEVLDLSEKHLIYFTATALNDPSSPQNGEGTHHEGDATSGDKMDMGGTPFYATSMFSSGVGPNITTRAYPASSGITSSDMSDVLAYRGKRGKKQIREIDGNLVEFCYAPEDDWSISEKYRFLQSYILNESYILPTPAGKNADKEYEYNPAATEAIKKQLCNNRAVQIGFKADKSLPDEVDDGVYLSKNWAHYTYKQEKASHAVTIVGWDDDYDKSNFVEGHEPPENGAWLVKNSWGSEEREFPDNGGGIWGIVDPETGLHTGYFWLSYYDQSLEKPEALAFDRSSAGGPYYIDQHDYMPVSDADSGVAAASISISNVFRAKQNQRLTEISCQTSIPGTTVSYAVYLLNDSFKNPRNGVKAASGEEYYEFGGYHKISLKNPVLIRKGQKYSIVVTQVTPDGKYAFSMQYGVGETLALFQELTSWQEGIINYNESYICIDGEWFDFADPELLESLSSGKYDLWKCDNFPIKGYSVKAGDIPEEPKTVTPKVKLSKTAYTYNGKVRKPKVTVSVGGTVLNASDYTVKYASGRKNVGKYKVTVKLKGKYRGSKAVYFKINPKGTSIKSVKKGKKSVTVKWKKQSAKMSVSRIRGYQIQIATDKKFTKNKKTVKVKGYKKVSKKVTKLKSAKKYYVRIRTYRIKGEKTYYSPWSKVVTCS